MTTLPERLQDAVTEDMLWFLADAAKILSEQGNELHVPALRELHTLLEAAATLQAAPEGWEVVCYGLRRKGSTAIIGIVPNKVAAKPATVEWFNENYEEVPLCLATPAPATTSVSLCPKHGMYAKKGCADCEADIDMLTRIEPPDPSPTHPAAAQKEPTK